MSQDFAQPARVEVPAVARPISLCLKTLDQLSADCFDAPPAQCRLQVSVISP